MKVMFKAESKFAGKDEWEEEVETEKEFDELVKKQQKHYETAAKYDTNLTVTASVVKDDEVIYFKQLV